MNPVIAPVSMQKIGPEFAIAWSDGGESYVALESLRRACPCAACGDEPDVLGRVIRPDVTYGTGSFELVGWDVVGGYGVMPRWGDGHRTGIYTFDYLRRLGQLGA
jgi:DUF971 family protein